MQAGVWSLSPMTPEANAADLIQRQQRSKFLSTNKIFPHSLEILLEFEAFLSFFCIGFLPLKNQTRSLLSHPFMKYSSSMRSSGAFHNCSTKFFCT
jgi:hypothetical protein